MLRLSMFCGVGILVVALLVGVGATQEGKKDKDEKGKKFTA
jgi:hypothetical protein